MPMAIIALSLTLLVSCNSLSSGTETKNDKTIIGEIAFIGVEESGFKYESRIDTGATTTSINAFEIKIKGEEKDKEKNINKLISFKTRNRTGQVATINTRIENVIIVANSQGREARYVVDLNLEWKGKSRKIRVNLRDRRNMTYKLLIGRNWLEGHYLVDVSKKEHGEEKSIENSRTTEVKIQQYDASLNAIYWDKKYSVLYPSKFKLVELDGKKMYRVHFPGQSSPIDLEPSPNSKPTDAIAFGVLTFNGQQVKTELKLMKHEKGIDLHIGEELKKLTSGDSK